VLRTALLGRSRTEPLPSSVMMLGDMARQRRTRRRPGLRTRATVAAGLAALLVSVALSMLTYALVRNYVLEQRDSVALRQTYANAKVVRDALDEPATNVSQLLASIRAEPGGVVYLNRRSGWFQPRAGLSPEEVLPVAVLDAVANRTTGRQRFSRDGVPFLAVAVSMPQVDAAYVEVFPLEPLVRTLDILRNSLVVAAFVTTIGGGLLGVWSSARVLRPLSRVSRAASSLASGGLDVRLTDETDPDLDRLVVAFNAMADAVQARIEREARFAADVSHELRTPLAAIAASLEVIERRRDDLPDRARQALDLLSVKVHRLERTVQDLLEITRMDAGGDVADPEPVILTDVVRRIAESLGTTTMVVRSSGQADRKLLVDKRRVERIVANLLENAQVHADGPVCAVIDVTGGRARLEVHDAGPGVPMAERGRVFERFARGSAGNRRPGSGLGLAIVAEHAHRLGGSVRIDDRPGGGSIFVVTFPVETP
jgi:two-component system, OmpR family, sensor histidine kinase MtrB